MLPVEDELEDTTFFFPYGSKRRDYTTLTSTIPTIRYALRIREAYREGHYRDNTMERLHKKRDFAVITPLELLEQARSMRMMFLDFTRPGVPQLLLPLRR